MGAFLLEPPDNQQQEVIQDLTTNYYDQNNDVLREIENELEQIRKYLFVMMQNSTLIKDDIDIMRINSTTMAEKQTIMADKQTLMETHQRKLRELGEGNGIRWRRPSEWNDGAATYRVRSGSGDESSESRVSIENISENYNNNN